MNITGTLALVGSGEYLPPMAEVDKALLARLAATHPGKAHVVCLPTAAGEEGPERIQYWSELGVNHFSSLGVEAEAVGVIDRQTAENPALADRIGQASFVYLSGGHPAYLYKTLLGTPVWEAISGVLASGGVVAGCSAGAMIFAERILGFRNFQISQEGFNILPGTIILPHYDEFPGAAASLARQALSANLVLVGIEGNTALSVSGESAQVLGRGGVTVWKKHSKKRLTAEDPVIELKAITCAD
jgi:cyanophycinase